MVFTFNILKDSSLKNGAPGFTPVLTFCNFHVLILEGKGNKHFRRPSFQAIIKKEIILYAYI